MAAAEITSFLKGKPANDRLSRQLRQKVIVDIEGGAGATLPAN
jgi:hypothetical protein